MPSRWRYELLLDAGQALDEAPDPTAAAQVLVDLVCDRLGGLAIVGLLEADGPRIVAFATADPGRRDVLAEIVRTPAWGADGGLAEVMRTGGTMLLEPVDEAFVRGQVEGEEARRTALAFVGHGFVIAPLVARGQIVGAIAQGRLGSLDADDLELLQDLGRRAGLSLAALTRLERERALRSGAEAAGAMLDELIEAAPIGFAFFDTDLRYVRLNAELERINGLPAAEHLGRRPSDVLATGGPEVEAVLAEVLADGRPRQSELRVRLPGSPDRERVFGVGVYRVRLPGGEPLGIGVTAFELTDRSAAEAALQAQRDLYARLLEAQDSLGEAVFVVGGGRFEWVNHATCVLAGRTPEELTGLASVLDIVAPDQRSPVAARMAEVLRGGEAVRFDARLRRPDGSDVWVEIAGRALLAEGGEPRVIGVGRDIDERKQAELERERTHERTALLADAAGLLEASLDLRRVLHGAAKLVVERALCTSCAFEVAERDGWRRVAEAPDRADVDSDFVLPLVSGGERVGRMLVEAPRDIGLLTELATRVAPVVVNARLYEERVRIARVLQESLLPPGLPPVPGLEVATRYAPGAARLDVGGDFYDLFLSDSDVHTAVVGDVCGKGAEAAALTSLARHTLRALASSQTDPAALLAGLNAAILREQLPPERFITMVLARLALGTEGVRLDIACAGHPPPLVVRADGRTEDVPARGTALGIAGTVAYDVARVDLRPGDLAVLYTDGLSEAARARTDRSFVDVATRLRADGAEAVAAGLQAWAHEQRGGGEANDDLALLVLRAV